MWQVTITRGAVTQCHVVPGYRLQAFLALAVRTLKPGHTLGYTHVAG